MIAFLRGRVAGRSGDAATIDVKGVGVSVVCTPATLSRLHVGEEATVATSLVVREDSLTLYGFVDEDERDVFERLQAAGGVGPRLALAMLAVHSPDALRRAVAVEDTAALTRVAGIGKKGAQRIVLELKGKLDTPAGAAADTSSEAAGEAASQSRNAQVVAGLVNLGWPRKDAEAAAEAAAAEAGDETDVAVLLRGALRKLSRA